MPSTASRSPAWAVGPNGIRPTRRGTAIESGLVSRFGAIDNTDGGNTYRYSGSVELQRSASNTSTKVTAFGIGYNLNLFSELHVAF